MGLSISLAVYIAFRAGRRLRNLTDENMEERLSDFTFDSLRELISNKLDELFGDNGVQLPGRVSIQQVADHLHEDLDDLTLLQTIYHSLLEQGILSQYYIEAVTYIGQLLSGGT